MRGDGPDEPLKAVALPFIPIASAPTCFDRTCTQSLLRTAALPLFVDSMEHKRSNTAEKGHDSPDKDLPAGRGMDRGRSGRRYPSFDRNMTPPGETRRLEGTGPGLSIGHGRRPRHLGQSGIPGRPRRVRRERPPRRRPRIRQQPGRTRSGHGEVSILDEEPENRDRVGQRAGRRPPRRAAPAEGRRTSTASRRGGSNRADGARSCSDEDLLTSMERLELATRLPSFEDEETDGRRSTRAYGRHGEETEPRRSRRGPRRETREGSPVRVVTPGAAGPAAGAERMTAASCRSGGRSQERRAPVQAPASNGSTRSISTGRRSRSAACRSSVTRGTLPSPARSTTTPTLRASTG